MHFHILFGHLHFSCKMSVKVLLLIFLLVIPFSYWFVEVIKNINSVCAKYNRFFQLYNMPSNYSGFFFFSTNGTPHWLSNKSLQFSLSDFSFWFFTLYWVPFLTLIFFNLIWILHSLLPLECILIKVEFLFFWFTIWFFSKGLNNIFNNLFFLFWFKYPS